MNVLELFRRLSLGELSNLALANDGNGTIREADKPKIVMHANTALQRLYSRFILRERTILVQTAVHKTTYHLHPKHAFSNFVEGSGIDCFIVDSEADPFLGDLIRILEASESTGRNLSINNSFDPDSIHLPAYDTIQVPSPMCGQAIAINYQADHPNLLDGDETQEIELPEILEEAMTAFIGHQVFSGMTSQEASARADKLAARYEVICMDAEQRDLLSTSRSSNASKFDDRGWA